MADESKKKAYYDSLVRAGVVPPEVSYDAFNLKIRDTNFAKIVYSGLKTASELGIVKDIPSEQQFNSVLQSGEFPTKPEIYKTNQPLPNVGATQTNQAQQTTPTTTTETEVVSEEETPQQGTPARRMSPIPQALVQKVQPQTNQPQPTPEETQIAPIDQQAGQVQGGMPQGKGLGAGQFQITDIRTQAEKPQTVPTMPRMEPIQQTTTTPTGQATPLTTPPPQQVGYFDYLGNAVERGLNRGEIADYISATGKTPTAEEFARIAELNAENERLFTSKAMQDFANNPDLESTLKSLPEIAIESIASLYRHGLARMGVGAVAGGVAGSVIPVAGTLVGAGTGALSGMSVAGLGLEVSGTIMEGLNELKIDTKNPEALKTAFSNPAVMDYLKQKAYARGIPIAALDAVSMGVAGTLLGKPVASAVSRGLKVLGEAVIQGVFGAGGEFLAELNSGEKIKGYEILAEGLAEIPGSIPEVGIAVLSKNKGAGKDTKVESARLALKSPDMPIDAINESIDVGVGTGEISATQATELKQEVAKAREINAKIPAEIKDTELRVAAIGLIEERDNLNAQLETVDEAFRPAIQEKIKGINEQLANMAKPEVTTEQQITPAPATAEVKTTENESIKNRNRKDLFPDETEFANVIGGSGRNSNISSYREVNGIGVSEYTNPENGLVDVIMTGTSDNDYVGYVRIYERKIKDGKVVFVPTNRWTSKMENKSGNKENFKTMVTEVQKLLPQDHEYTEKTNISLDGLRVFSNNLKRGYEVLTDNNGNPITNSVPLNNATLESLQQAKTEEEVESLYSKKTGITREEFNKIKQQAESLIPNIKLFFNEADGSVVINLPVLKKSPATTEVATETVVETPTGTTAEAEVTTTPQAGAEAMTDRQLQDIVGVDVFKAIQRAESQLGEGVVDRKRLIDTAKKIQQKDNKPNLLPEHIFEALQYETGYPDNWQDLRNAIQKGGIDANSDAIQRQIEVGIELPTDIVEEFKKSKAYENASPELITQVEQLLTPTQDEDKTGLILYHGSPHSFKEFDISKLGSGEGVQAFGHGLYFTNEVDIAKGYANKLGSKKNFWEALKNGNEISLTKEDFDFIKNEIEALGFDGYSAEQSNIGDIRVDGKNEYAPDVLEALAVAFGKNAKYELENFDLTEEQVNRLIEIKRKISDPQLYKISAHEGKSPSEYDYIDWREKLTDSQRKKIGGEFADNVTGEEVYKSLSQKLGSDQKASEFLLSKGIDGITYKSNKGTGGKTGKGRNYVIFDTDAIRIDEINQQKQQTPTQDAVQKQTASQVPVQSGTTSSQEMAKGEPKAEPQSTADKGQAKATATQEEVGATPTTETTTTTTEVTLNTPNETTIKDIEKIENATEKGRELALSKPVNKWVKRAFDSFQDLSSRAKKAGIYDGTTLKIGGKEYTVDTPAKFKAFLAQSQANFDAINEAVDKSEIDVLKAERDTLIQEFIKGMGQMTMNLNPEQVSRIAQIAWKNLQIVAKESKLSSAAVASLIKRKVDDAIAELNKFLTQSGQNTLNPDKEDYTNIVNIIRQLAEEIATTSTSTAGQIGTAGQPSATQSPIYTKEQEELAREMERKMDEGKPFIARSEPFWTAVKRKVAELRQKLDSPRELLNFAEKMIGTTPGTSYKRTRELPLGRAMEQLRGKARNLALPYMERISDALKPIEKHLPDFEKYLIYRRIIDRNQQDKLNQEAYRQGLLKDKPKRRITGGMTETQADILLNKLANKVGPKVFNQFIDAGDNLQVIFDDNLKDLVNAGVLTQDRYNAIKSQNEFYVPFDVVQRDFRGNVITGTEYDRSTAQNQSVIKRIEGMPVPENAAKADEFIGAVYKMMEKGEIDADSYYYLATNKITDARNAGNITQQEYENLMDLLSEPGLELHSPLNKTLNIINASQYQVARQGYMKDIDMLVDADTNNDYFVRLENKDKLPSGMSVITYYKDGVQQRVAVDEKLKQAIDTMTSPELNAFEKFLKSGSFLFKVAATSASISFLPVNFVIDLTRSLTSKAGLGSGATVTERAASVVQIPVIYSEALVNAIIGNLLNTKLGNALKLKSITPNFMYNQYEDWKKSPSYSEGSYLGHLVDRLKSGRTKSEIEDAKFLETVQRRTNTILGNPKTAKAIANAVLGTKQKTRMTVDGVMDIVNLISKMLENSHKIYGYTKLSGTETGVRKGLDRYIGGYIDKLHGQKKLTQAELENALDEVTDEVLNNIGSPNFEQIPPNMRAASIIVPFLGAAVKGNMSDVSRVLNSVNAGASKKERLDALAFTARNGAVFLIPAFITGLTMALKDDDDESKKMYDDMDENSKWSNSIIPVERNVDGEEGQFDFITIPIRGVPVIFNSIGRASGQAFGMSMKERLTKEELKKISKDVLLSSFSSMMAFNLADKTYLSDIDPETGERKKTRKEEELLNRSMSFASGLNPVIKYLPERWANKNFFGKYSIEPENIRGKRLRNAILNEVIDPETGKPISPSLLKNKFTPDYAVTLSKYFERNGIRMSPMIIDHLFDTFLAGAPEKFDVGASELMKRRFLWKERKLAYGEKPKN